MPKDYNLDDILNEYSEDHLKPPLNINQQKFRRKRKSTLTNLIRIPDILKYRNTQKNADITAAFNINELQSAEKRHCQKTVTKS